MIKAAEEASGAERSLLLLERRADAEREESRCLGAQKDLRISELEAQVRGHVAGVCVSVCLCVSSSDLSWSANLLVNTDSRPL